MLNQSSPGGDIQIKSNSRFQPLFAIFLILISVLAFTFVARPVANDVEALKADYDSQEEILDELKAEIFQLEDAEEKMGLSTEVQRTELLKKIPVGINQDEVIDDLVSIAASNDIELGSIGFSQGASGKDGVGVLKISSSFDGGYSDLVNFLKGIESNSRMFKVDSISVQIKVLDVTKYKRATFALSISAFYQIDNQ